MKNLMKIAAALLLITAFAQDSNAQFKFNAGVELGFAMEDGMGLMYGLAVGGEFAAGDNMGITVETGYDMIAVDGDGASASVIPMQAGLKYYFDSNEGGMYLHGQAGFTITTVTVSFFGATASASSTNLSLAPGVGYVINEKIDIGADYNLVLGDGSFGYIAARAAYKF